MKTISIVLSILITAPAIFAQDPGDPDEVIVGNVDGTPIYALPGSVIDIPVWAKTDEDVVGIHLPAGTEDQFITARLGGNLESIFDDWEMILFNGPSQDTPQPGYTSQCILGTCRYDPPWECTILNSNGEYLKIAEFSVQISSDPSNIGESTQIIFGPDLDGGDPVFMDTDYNMWYPTVTGGTITIASENIPTLSEWGMLLMGLLLVAIGTAAVVKRRKVALNKAV
ncbi:MAG: IPTL-CTERM sorting domain-containing protein [candidate division Zixibacteria bacterium]